MCGWGGHHSAVSCPCSARELVSPLRSRRLKMKNQQNTARFDHAHTLAACAALQLLNLAGDFVVSLPVARPFSHCVLDSSLAPPPRLRMAQTYGRKVTTQRNYNTHHMSLATARATRRPLGEAMCTKRWVRVPRHICTTIFFHACMAACGKTCMSIYTCMYAICI